MLCDFTRRQKMSGCLPWCDMSSLVLLRSLNSWGVARWKSPNWSFSLDQFQNTSVKRNFLSPPVWFIWGIDLKGRAWKTLQSHPLFTSLQNNEFVHQHPPKAYGNLNSGPESFVFFFFSKNTYIYMFLTFYLYIYFCLCWVFVALRASL